MMFCTLSWAVKANHPSPDGKHYTKCPVYDCIFFCKKKKAVIFIRPLGLRYLR